MGFRVKILFEGFHTLLFGLFAPPPVVLFSPGSAKSNSYENWFVLTLNTEPAETLSMSWTRSGGGAAPAWPQQVTGPGVWTRLSAHAQSPGPGSGGRPSLPVRLLHSSGRLSQNSLKCIRLNIWHTRNTPRVQNIYPGAPSAASRSHRAALWFFSQNFST